MRCLALLGLALAGLVLGCSGSDEDLPAQQSPVAVEPGPLQGVEVIGPQGRLDHDYTLDLRPSDPTAEPRTFQLVGGALPAGLELKADGTIGGKPSMPGARESLVAAQGACGEPSCRLLMHVTIRITDVVLVSGFGPWPEAPVNPSWQAVEPLQEALIGGYDVRVIELPVVWDDSMPLFWAEYNRLHPVIAIGAGVAMGESRVRLESKAVNQAVGADNNNDTWPQSQIDPAGPSSYQALLPINLLKNALTDAGYPVVVSSSAGNFLCNFMFYNLMKQLEAENPELHILGGFVHVPKPEAVTPEKMTEAFKLMIGKLAAYRESLLWDQPAPDDGPALPTVDTPPVY